MNRPLKAFTDLNRDDRRLIWEHLKSRQYYLLTGSGVSLDSNGPSGQMRSASKLNADLCDLVEIDRRRSLQQAYSLLEPDQVEAEITTHYTTKVVGETIACLTNLPWRRVYTLNVDDAFEKSVRDSLRLQMIEIERFQIFNFNDDYRDLLPDTVQSIVHLHGFVEQAQSGYVFSHSEYAKNISKPNSWMSTLTQLMRAEPFIVAGTTLDEADVTFYLEQRPSSGHVFTPEVPSIIIEPFPDKLTERLCRTHDFVLYNGDTLTFFKMLEEEFGTLGNAFAYWGQDAALPSSIKPADRSGSKRRLSGFLLDPSQTNRLHAFYLAPLQHGRCLRLMSILGGSYSLR